jgi:hypothetical protein
MRKNARRRTLQPDLRRIAEVCRTVRLRLRAHLLFRFCWLSMRPLGTVFSGRGEMIWRLAGIGALVGIAIAVPAEADVTISELLPVSMTPS